MPQPDDGIGARASMKTAEAGGSVAGSVGIYNSSATSHVIVDVTGFFF